jgi:alpha-beta hydrolase superfamily lysophospholipase
VFLPGTMTHPLFYEEFCDGLSEPGVTVIGVHLEGHGKSPRVARVLRWATVIQNALDSIEWARERFGRCPVLLGTSQGGVLAIVAAKKDSRLAGVVAHNVLDPALAASLSVSRLPAWLRPMYRPLVRAVQALALVAPRTPIPFRFYLDITRVCRETWTAEQFLTDPLGRRSYPLVFLAGLFTADLSTVHDGPIACPVIVLAGRDDPLFSLAYTRQVFERVSAPQKELIVFDTDRHLLFNEALPLILGPVIDVVTRLDGRTRKD